MDIKQIESFVCVAQMGSMTAAAQMLYLTAPALAQQMNRLEKEVKVPLFMRSPRGMTLTPAGECFYEDALQILAMTTNMIRRCQEAGQQAEHIVRIGSVKGLVPDLYPGIQRAVRSRCPDIQLEHTEDTLEELRKMLLLGQIDALELFDSPLTRHPHLQYIPLITEGRNCLMTADHPLAGKPRITLEDLIGQDVCVYDFARVPGLQDYVQASCPRVKLRSNTSSDAQSAAKGQNGYYATLALCESGSLCLIPPHCAHFFAPLISVPLDIPLTWSCGLICRKDLRRHAQAALDAAIAEFTQ